MNSRERERLIECLSAKMTPEKAAEAVDRIEASRKAVRRRLTKLVAPFIGLLLLSNATIYLVIAKSSRRGYHVNVALFTNIAYALDAIIVVTCLFRVRRVVQSILMTPPEP